MAQPIRRDTKDRLVAAATTLFAERGFHGTTVRDIAELADANVAAGNYHYGSKKALYLEVLRAQFAEVRAMLDAQGANLPTAELARLDRAALVRVLRTRVRVMLEMLLGPPPSVHGALMQREMVDPSEAMPVIVAEFIRPMFEEMYDIVAHLVPSLDRQNVERCVHSIIAQGLFYRFNRPVVLEMLAIEEYPETLAGELTDHITEFSLGGLEALAARRSRGRRAR